MTPLKKRRFTRESLVESPYILTATTSSLATMSTPPPVAATQRSMSSALDVNISSPPSQLLSPPPSHFMSSPLSSLHRHTKSVDVSAREEVDAAHMLLSLTGSGSIDKILGRSQLNGVTLPKSPVQHTVSNLFNVHSYTSYSQEYVMDQAFIF